MEMNDATMDDVAKALIMPVGGATEKEEKIVEEDTKEEASDEVEGVEVSTEEDSEEADTEEESSNEEDEDVDVDELEVDVTVDGETKPVKLKELKARYAGEGAIEKRLQEATERNNKVNEIGNHLFQTLEAEKERIKQLDAVLQRVAEPQINWDELRQKDPARYLLEKERVREAQEKRDILRREQERATQQQQALQKKALEDYTVDQAKALVKHMPEFADPVKASEKMNSLVRTAAAYDYTPEEVSSVLDHRAWRVLEDARKWQEHVANKKEVVKKDIPVKALVKPGKGSAATKTMTNQQKLQKALVAKARASGRPEDVAKLLIVRNK